MKNTKVFASVWDAISDTTEQAANLRARAELIHKIAGIVKGNQWTQVEAARRCGVTQPRINDLLRARISRFSLDALVNMASALGLRLTVESIDKPQPEVAAKASARKAPRKEGKRERIATRARVASQ
jgi:predicted XRE-type DNA-binding protein